ncbi:flagellar FlbD family protein [Paenarthrobacter sp. NPDC018779]|uniref:flagellar FlbD family protein n=1 Tax=Paenarthrobacter sp. NPDC018779 TaxID=3364375 RepID=UPI0037CB7EF8
MIVVTRLNGTRFAVNPDILERIHESPDTHLVTLDGAAYVVRESLVEVVELIAEYRAGVLRRAQDLPRVTGYPLSLVPQPTREPDAEAGPEDHTPRNGR